MIAIFRINVGKNLLEGYTIYDAQKFQMVACNAGKISSQNLFPGDNSNLFSMDHKVRMLLFTFFLTAPYLHLNTADTNLIAEYFLTSKKRHKKLSHHTIYTVDSGQMLLPKNYAAVYRQYHLFSK
jgi:hypothetical protein